MTLKPSRIMGRDVFNRSVKRIRELQAIKQEDKIKGEQLFSFTKFEKEKIKAELLTWRDKYTGEIEIGLRNDFSSLEAQLSQIFDELTFIEATLNIKTVITEKIEPVIENWKEKHALDITRMAESELNQIISFQFYRSSHKLEIGNIKHSEHYYEGAAGLASLWAGLAGIPLTNALAYSTTGGLFGMFTTTIISWPVVIIGGGAIGTALIFGGNKMAKIKRNSISRLKATVQKEVRKSILGSGESNNESLCTVLQRQIESIYGKIMQDVINV